MKVFFKIALRSLWHRRETVLLGILSLSFSVFLIVGVERLRQAAQDGFTQTISQTDLVVGARTGPTNLVLSMIFNRGFFANNITWSTYNEWRQHPAVQWTIPLVLGDGHRGFRVVGTNEDFLKHYHFQGDSQLRIQQGEWFKERILKGSEGTKDQKPGVVIGEEVAQRLRYRLGDVLVLEHGVTREAGFLKHDDEPLVVCGILAATGTIIDQSLFVATSTLTHMHEASEGPGSPVKHNNHHADRTDHADHDNHADHADHPHHEKESDVSLTKGYDGPPNKEHKMALTPEEPLVTGFLVGLKNRVDVLALQRSINDFKKEPLSAVIPSVVMNDLWQMVSQVETALRFLGFCILVICLLSLVSNFLASFGERRREMAILRSMGVGPQQLGMLYLIESTVVSVVAILLGLFLLWSLTQILGGWVRGHYGLLLPTFLLGDGEVFQLLWILLISAGVSIIPAYRVYSTSLKDGLIVR